MPIGCRLNTLGSESRATLNMNIRRSQCRHRLWLPCRITGKLIGTTHVTVSGFSKSSWCRLNFPSTRVAGVGLSAAKETPEPACHYELRFQTSHSVVSLVPRSNHGHPTTATQAWSFKHDQVSRLSPVRISYCRTKRKSPEPESKQETVWYHAFTRLFAIPTQS